jgi:SET domain-containing protein
MIDRANVIVKTSHINGEGVFALRFIRRGEVAVKWDNTREIDESELASLPPGERNYIEIQGGKILLIGKPERFINHSCEANTLPGERCDIATRDIQAGEEITADYRNFYIPSGQFLCTCGSPKCRRVIHGVSGE